MPAMLVDITTTLSMRAGAPNKYTRVEEGLAAAVLEKGGRAVRFDRSRNAFVYAQLPVRDENASFENRALAGDFRSAQENAGLVKRFERSVVGWLIVAASALRLPLPKETRHGLAWRLAQIAKFMPYERRVGLAQRLGVFADRDLLTNFEHWLKECGAAQTPSWSKIEAAGNESVVTFAEGDQLVLAGAGWCYLDFRALASLKARCKIRIIGIIYDLMPVDSPALVTVEERNRYGAYLRNMAQHCDALVTPSDHIAQRLTEYLAKRDACKNVRIATLRLCAGLAGNAPAVPSPRIADLRLAERPFALVVSAIRFRKGQIWLAGLWEKIHRRFGARAPILIFAGTPLGSGFLTPCLAEQDIDCVHGNLLIGPSDEELAWLYRNASFTLYPAIEDSLGMPIMESAAYDKYCLCGDAPSLVEASAGCAFHAGRDETLWIEEIARLIDDPTYLAAKTAGATPARAWRDVVQDMRRL
jgi:glycosyltransferase involved in cell wall biosynthesis